MAGVGVKIAPLHPLDRHEDVVVRDDIPELQAVRRVVGLACDGPPAGTLAEGLQACELSVKAGPTMAAFHQGAVSSVG